MVKRILWSFGILILFPSADSSHYEMILESVENAFGENDKIIEFPTLRVKKFNRTA
jgi:hypothetical protein